MAIQNFPSTSPVRARLARQLDIYIFRPIIKMFAGHSDLQDKMTCMTQLFAEPSVAGHDDLHGTVICRTECCRT